MTAFHRPAFHEEFKHHLTRPRLQPLNPRNYNSHKQLTSNGFDLEPYRTSHEASRLLEPLPSIEREKGQNRKQSVTKFRLINQRQRYEIMRRNASLRLLKREDGRSGLRSKADDGKTLEALIGAREDKTSMEPQSQNSIPLKRGQLLKRGHNYLKINKRYDLEKEQQKSDVSFEDGLQKVHPEDGKTEPTAICSQNVLGNGIRKFSAAKMKALVTNPFQRMMRQQEEAKEKQSHKIPPSEAQQFKQSQILEGDNCPSTAEQQELRELLGMM